MSDHENRVANRSEPRRTVRLVLVRQSRPLDAIESAHTMSVSCGQIVHVRPVRQVASNFPLARDGFCGDVEAGSLFCDAQTSQESQLDDLVTPHRTSRSVHRRHASGTAGSAHIQNNASHQPRGHGEKARAIPSIEPACINRSKTILVHERRCRRVVPLMSAPGIHSKRRRGSADQ
jgi:hypothetical protein